MRIVICGAGVVGACAAYFLGRRGIHVIVIERAEVAAAASGPISIGFQMAWSSLIASARPRPLR
jgi:glycine/D-amino acid oxidase-like deaminating enzyme